MTRSDFVLTEPTVRIQVYKYESPTPELYPAREGGGIAEFTDESEKLIRVLYSWTCYDDIRSVLSEQEMDRFQKLIIDPFAASGAEDERTPKDLIDNLIELRAQMEPSKWTQTQDGDHLALAHTFLNHLEIIASTYLGLSEIRLVIQ